MKNEESVLMYIKSKDKTPLCFHFPYGNNFLSAYRLRELITEILDLSDEFPSYNVDNEIETDCGRWRSVLDIWRHVIYYKPDINIFEVMRELFSIGDEYLVGHYCRDILKRVFKLRKNTNHCSLFIQDRDEFGLCFSAWETIGMEE